MKAIQKMMGLVKPTSVPRRLIEILRGLRLPQTRRRKPLQAGACVDLPVLTRPKGVSRFHYSRFEALHAVGLKTRNTPQRKTTLGVMAYTDTLQFIKYKPSPNSRDSLAGTVDMNGYLQWLSNHGYNIDMNLL